MEVVIDDDFLLLKEWIDKNHRPPYERAKDTTERDIGRKCEKIRKYKKDRKLEQNDIDRFEGISDWTWDKMTKFSQMVADVKQWIAEQDQSRLPTITKNDKIERNLGRWCADKRIEYKKGELNEDQIRVIMSIPNWYWEKDDFDKVIEKIKNYVAKEKMLPSRTNKNNEISKLGIWIQNRKSEYVRDELSSENIDKLSSIEGLDFDNIKRKSSRDERVIELRKFLIKNERMPQKDTNSEDSLYDWCCRMRYLYNRGELEKDIQDKLKELNKTGDYWYWNECKYLDFNKMYERLETFIKYNKRLPKRIYIKGSKTTDNMTENEQNEEQLHNWIESIYRSRKNGTLDYDKMVMLEKIKMWVWRI